MAFVVGWVVTGRSPSNEGNWKAEYARLPKVGIDGDWVTVTDLRNFSYGEDGSIVDAVYEERVYDLAQLDELWYGISHFADYGLAHTFLSFRFGANRYLSLSIEARQEVGQSYSPLIGLLRAYHLTYVFGDERDIVGLRTHIRDEQVYLYKVAVEPGPIRTLFMKIAANSNALIDTPEFYNTVTDNCTTSLLQYWKESPSVLESLNYRVLLPGFSDELLYKEGLLGRKSSLQALRAMARLDPDVVSLDDPDFSEKIRGL